MSSNQVVGRRTGLGRAGGLAAPHPRRVGADLRAPATAHGLRRTLVLTDLGAVGLGWAAASVLLAATQPASSMLAAAGFWLTGVLSCLGLMGLQHLYRARVCTVRAVETRLLGRAAAGSALGAVALHALLVGPAPWGAGLLGAATAFVALMVTRGGYRSWLSAQRQAGHHMRPVLLVGANEDAGELLALTRDHPDLGFRVLAVVASADQTTHLDVPWVGELEHLDPALAATNASGVIFAANALPPKQLREVARGLVDRGFHVHLSSGLWGITSSRLRTLPMAHEPLFYLEPPTLSGRQVQVKQVMDACLAAVAIVAFMPVMALAALAIKLEDRGPALYRQERIGKGNRPFRIYKLRTMTTDADRRREEVAGLNRRGDGPLFKAAHDPRVTRVGRILRATSLDEVPQFLNVLQGTMSLVGPRPALPEEVEQFDEELQARSDVLPGITGLWQTEARDNPSFGAYRRLDLHYVENWSVGLDIGILLATAEGVVERTLRAALGRRATERDGDEEGPHAALLG